MRQRQLLQSQTVKSLCQLFSSQPHELSRYSEFSRHYTCSSSSASAYPNALYFWQMSLNMTFDFFFLLRYNQNIKRYHFARSAFRLPRSALEKSRIFRAKVRYIARKTLLGQMALHIMICKEDRSQDSFVTEEYPFRL